MTYEVRLTQTLELSTRVDAPNEKVALEMARMEMRAAGAVVDEHHQVTAEDGVVESACCEPAGHLS